MMQLGNKPLLIVALVVAVALPVTAHQAMQQRVLQQQLKLELAQLKTQKQQTLELDKEESKYSEFVNSVNSLIERINAGGIGGEGWDTHQVKIDKVKMSVGQLDQVVRQAQHGYGYYFIPTSFTIRSARHSDTGAIDLSEVLNEDKKGTELDKVLVSMNGEFMVKK